MSLEPNADRWRDRFFASTRGRIVALLRSEPRTVNDLAEQLDLTDNAVRSHLSSLERDGLTERAGERRGSGKPSTVYGITRDAEDLYPKAYSLVLSSLLETMEERLDPRSRAALLEEAGRRLAAAAPIERGADLDARVESAASLLTDLGGLAEVTAVDGRRFIQGKSCPLLDTAAERPEICRLAAALIETMIDEPVAVCCRYGEQPRCCFEIGTDTRG